MIFTKPQLIRDLFLNGFKTYRKIFIPMLPISALASFAHLVSRGLGMLDQSWVSGVATAFLLFAFFCFCWGINFLYSFMVKQEIDYKVSFEITFDRMLRAAGLLIIGIISILMLATLSLSVLNFLSAEKVVLRFLYASLVMILFVPVVCFTFISVLEVVIKDAKFVPAVKKALRVSFRLETIWRVLAFFLIMLFLTAVIFIPTFLLLTLFAWLELKMIVLLVIGAFFVFLTMAFLWVPLKMVVLVYLYNDLVLRFEGQKS